MRFTKKIIASALAVCMGSALGAAPAFAAGLKLDQPYEYTISVSAGSGEFRGLDETLSQVPYGELINLSAYINEANIALPDPNYYVKGLRYAGHDFGDEGMAPLAFVATEDVQYVVAYGLAKDQVAYTVNYVDAAGNQIADSQTFYGNPGDKPVVAFRYIDGYLPTAYNLTGTLQAGQPNEFTFTYNAAPGVVYETVVTPAAGGDAGAAAVAPAGAAAVADAAAAGEILGDDGTPLAAPEDIVDLDDNENPLASGAVSDDAASANNILPYVIGGVVAVAAILLLIALAMRKKKAPTRS